MKPISNKRAAIERAYRQAKQQLWEDSDKVCVGCGCNKALSCSHRIPRRRRQDLIADINNLDIMCNACHLRVEAGLFDELENGEEIKEYIKMMDLEYYQIITDKGLINILFKYNGIGHLSLSTSNLQANIDKYNSKNNSTITIEQLVERALIKLMYGKAGNKQYSLNQYERLV